jgi:hypothetical protein
MVEMGLEEEWSSGQVGTSREWALLVKELVHVREEMRWKGRMAFGGVKGGPKTKLRRYARIKTELKKEWFLREDKVWVRRWVKLRAGVEALEVEQGRAKRVPREERICRCCGQGVEDEDHFVDSCARWVEERRKWRRVVEQMNKKKWEQISAGTVRARVDWLMKGGSGGKKKKSVVMKGIVGMLWTRDKDRRQETAKTDKGGKAKKARKSKKIRKTRKTKNKPIYDAGVKARPASPARRSRRIQRPSVKRKEADAAAEMSKLLGESSSEDDNGAALPAVIGRAKKRTPRLSKKVSEQAQRGRAEAELADGKHTKKEDKETRAEDGARVRAGTRPCVYAQKLAAHSPAETQQANSLVRRGGDGILCSRFNINVTYRLALCLRPGRWLNDEVVNFYMELLGERSRRREEGLKCHFFNSFFVDKFKVSYEYEHVQRWSKRAGVKILKMDKVFFPVNANQGHWCLAVINFIDKRFEYYDSMGGGDRGVLGHLRRYVQDEANQYSKQPGYDLSEWEDYTPHDVPQQDNGNDCGVFMCKFADYLSGNLELRFDAGDMPYFRDRMALELEAQAAA